MSQRSKNEQITQIESRHHAEPPWHGLRWTMIKPPHVRSTFEKFRYGFATFVPDKSTVSTLSSTSVNPALSNRWSQSERWILFMYCTSFSKNNFQIHL